jgi:hypothetical protein
MLTLRTLHGAFLSRPCGIVALRHPAHKCRGNANTLLPMTTVAGVPPFHSGGIHAERESSPAAGSAAVGSPVQRLVRQLVSVVSDVYKVKSLYQALCP